MQDMNVNTYDLCIIMKNCAKLEYTFQQLVIYLFRENVNSPAEADSKRSALLTGRLSDSGAPTLHNHMSSQN